MYGRELYLTLGYSGRLYYAFAMELFDLRGILVSRIHGLAI
jgi:hypothetical protein